MDYGRNYVYLWNLTQLKFRVTARLKELGKKYWTLEVLNNCFISSRPARTAFQKIPGRWQSLSLKSQGKYYGSGGNKMPWSSLFHYYHYLIITFYSIPNISNSLNSLINISWYPNRTYLKHSNHFTKVNLTLTSVMKLDHCFVNEFGFFQSFLGPWLMVRT